MQQVWVVLEQGRKNVERHPFFSWMNSENIPLRSRFIFSPVMIDFIMSFADMNKWFLRYDNPKSDLEASINEHTEEDATHSRFFVENWAALRLGDTEDWPASKGLWWLFLAREGAAVRQFGMEVLTLAVKYPDPLVRFSMMEAIEICGDVFFANTAPIAEQLRAQDNVEHIYYGQYHRERETGHLQADESGFVRAELSAEQRAQALGAAELVFRNFLKVLDGLLEFSRSAVRDYCGLQRRIEREYTLAVSVPLEELATGPGYLSTVKEHRAHADQTSLVAELERRSSELREHRFFTWLAQGPRSAVERLRGFTPLWAIDVVGYRDFNELVLRYVHPQTAAERAINLWTDELAARGVLFLHDWRALRLDANLGWRMRDVISYYFLSEHTEVHRRNMARIKKHAMGHEDPLVRWWLMYALERGLDACFERTRSVALEAEAELGVTLNYWARRHHFGAPGTVGREGFPFLEQPMSREICSVVRAIIATVFDSLEEQVDLSHEVASSGVFWVRPSSLPPPRISQVVPRHPSEPGNLLLAAGAAR